MRISLGSVYAQILAPSQDLGKGFITAKKVRKRPEFLGSFASICCGVSCHGTLRELGTLVGGTQRNGNSNVLAICGCLFGLAWGDFVTLPTKTFSIFSVHSYVLFYFWME